MSTPRYRLLAVTLIALSVLSASCGSAKSAARDKAAALPAMPQAVSNNAVASVTVDGNTYAVSFAGIGPGLAHDDTLATTFVLDQRHRTWRTGPALPGGVGRLASVAASAGTLVYVFGGYTVAPDGSEDSTPWVHSFDPVRDVFVERAPMPVPVDDAVALVYQDRYIYLVSGWHDLGNVNLVQRYDSVADEWSQATPLPGHGVFGHAGGIVDDTLVICDGVVVRANVARSRDFAATDTCYLGIVDSDDSRRIDWRRLGPHPGPARYRAAATGDADGRRILFVGGSANPYNFNGIGYDGIPAEPIGEIVAYDLAKEQWVTLGELPEPSMDHRGLVRWNGGWLLPGGMLARQTVTSRVEWLPLD